MFSHFKYQLLARMQQHLFLWRIKEHINCCNQCYNMVSNNKNSQAIFSFLSLKRILNSVGFCFYFINDNSSNNGKDHYTTLYLKIIELLKLG